MLRLKDRSIEKEEEMAGVFDLVAFFKGLCTSFGLSSFFFYNYSVCSEVIRKMFGALVSLRKPFISCSSTAFARDTDLSKKRCRNPMSTPHGKFLPVLAAAHSMCCTFQIFISNKETKSSKRRPFYNLGTHGKHGCLISPECG